MKRKHFNILFTIFISVMIFSCKNVEAKKEVSLIKTEITSAEKEEAKKAIITQIDTIIAGALRLDANAALKPYADEKDFMIVTPEGQIQNYAEMQKYQQQSMEQAKSMQFETVKHDFTFLEKDLVICTWSGINEFEMKTGEKFRIDPYVGTMIFRKINDDWKIIYAHETANLNTPPTK